MKFKFSLAAVAAFAFSSHLFAGSIVLSNNLTEPLDDIDSVTTTLWHGISFTTDNNAYTLDTVTLLMELGGSPVTSIANFQPNAVADIPEVDLYSDNSGAPGSLLAVLTAIDTPTDLLDYIGFDGAGAPLAANSTYWIVLKADSGIVSWGYPTTDNGSGIGFTDTYSATIDSGADWLAFVASQPDMADVTANIASVPEPSTVLMTGLGFLALGGALRRRFV